MNPTLPVRRLAAPAANLALSTIGLLAFFGTWFVVSDFGWAPKRVLPSPWDVAVTLYQISVHPFAGYTLGQHLISSLERFFAGFALAAAAGIPTGLLMGWYAPFRYAISPFFESLRFVAPLAWVPFAALWFGTGFGGPILIIFSGAFAPCVINSFRGARLVDERLIEAAQTLGASHLRLIVQVLLPGALPSIIAGLRISAALAWQSLIGSELIVVSSGVGYLIVQGQGDVAPAVVMAGMVAIGFVGIAIDAALLMIQRAIAHEWQGAAQ
jgi:ABC-type nitrate/sulfonate/bicarbonate transport system permease component